MMPNILQYPVAAFGVLRAGYTVVNVNPLYTARELRHQLKDSGAEVMVVMENFAHTVQDVLPDTALKTVVTTQLGDLLGFPKSWVVNAVVKYLKKMVPHWSIPGSVRFNDALKRGDKHSLNVVDIGPNDVAFLQYTGGTTGLAKGAILTHGNMVSNVQQASAWLSPVTAVGKETIITALPLYHIFSLTANCLTFMKLGAHNILITNPRDLPAFVKELKKYPFTAITGVNTLFNALLNTPGFADISFKHLKMSLGGGMAVQSSVAQRWKEATGMPLLEAYGLTETSPGVCINPLHLTDYTGTIGLPIPSTEISIRDENSEEVGIGQTGELCVRGPQVMQGYWNLAEDSVKAFTGDGFFRTGDMAQIDEKGYVKIVDRKKDMILVSGFNVYPNEVEEVVAGHPGVMEVAAVGVHDERAGEVVKIFVVRKDSALTEKELIEHCRKELTAYKVPKRVEFREELPKSNVGKILRRQLKEDPPPAT